MRTASPRRAVVCLLLLSAAAVFAWSTVAGSAPKAPPERRASDPAPSERYVPTREELEAPYQRQPPRPPANVFKAEITPHWFANNTRFWYRNDLRGGAKEFILVDAEKGQRDVAFDHKKLAES